MWAALHEKVPNVLSRCHTKRGATSFGITTTFTKKKNKQKKNLKKLKNVFLQTKKKNEKNPKKSVLLYQKKDEVKLWDGKVWFL